MNDRLMLRTAESASRAKRKTSVMDSMRRQVCLVYDLDLFEYFWYGSFKTIFELRSKLVIFLFRRRWSFRTTATTCCNATSICIAVSCEEELRYCDCGYYEIMQRPFTKRKRVRQKKIPSEEYAKSGSTVDIRSAAIQYLSEYFCSFAAVWQFYNYMNDEQGCHDAKNEESDWEIFANVMLE